MEEVIKKRGKIIHKQKAMFDAEQSLDNRLWYLSW